MAGMTAQELMLRVLADTSQAQKELSGINKRIDGFKQSAMTAGRAFAGAFSVGVIARFGAASVKAFAEAEASTALLRQAVENTGVAWDDYSEKIDTLVQKQSLMAAYDDELVADALRALTITTGNTAEAMNLLSLATDLARAKDMDLVSAAQLVGKVAEGNFGILARYGIVLKEGATATEALAAIQEKVAGAGEAYGDTTAGSLERLNVAMENFQETVGASLAPAAAEVVDWATQMLTKFGELEQDDQVSTMVLTVTTALATLAFGWQGAVVAAALFAGYMAGDWIAEMEPVAKFLDDLGREIWETIDAFNDLDRSRENLEYFENGGRRGGAARVGGGLMFANGGIASGPTSGYLATLHGTELIVPLSPNGSYLPSASPLPSVGGSSMYTINVTANSAADIPAIRAAVDDTLRSYVRTSSVLGRA